MLTLFYPLSKITEASHFCSQSLFQSFHAHMIIPQINFIFIYNKKTNKNYFDCLFTHVLKFVIKLTQLLDYKEDEED